MAFNWLCACKIRQADISRLRMVAISFSSLGICPIFATSSSRQRTCTGSLPPYTSSALSHKRLKSCVYIMATMKLKVSSVSEIMTKRAVFLSPNVSSSKSSVSISSRSSLMSKGAKRAPHEIKIDLAVLPAASLYFLYCFTAKCSGSFSSSRSNMRSTGFLKSSSSSLASLAFIMSSKVVKFFSSSGAS